MEMSHRTEDDLGEGLAPGSEHYRAFVGPPEDYDLIGALSFSLLTTLGLRQHHRLLDIGCGSLRVGRLLIPYLNSGGYTGFEPNRWLVEEGIEKECGRDQIELKRPLFLFEEDPDRIGRGPAYDFILAQSIFTHTGPDLLSKWLHAAARCLRANGAFVATYLEGESDHSAPGWIYPDCVEYRRETLEELADQCGLGFRRLDWRHPRQTWILFYDEGYPMKAFEDGSVVGSDNRDRRDG